MSKYREELAREKREAKEICLWMSFADPNKPKGTQFLGVVITKCYGLAHAMEKTRKLGINPGGAIQASMVDPNSYPPEHFDVLLSEADLRKADYI